MKTINRATLLGNVGRDPETRFTPSGTQVTTFSLATSSKRKNQSGEYHDVTQWHSCVAFGKLAEIVSNYVVKGSKLYAEGTIEYQSVEKEGVVKNYTKIIVNELCLLSSSPKNNVTDSNSQEIQDTEIPF